MKILTAEEMRRVDQLTSSRAGVSSRELMENAGRQVAAFLLEQFSPLGRVTILCGKGNNGGDGLVAARHLLERGHPPRVAVLAPLSELKGDARQQHDAFLKAGGEVEALSQAKEWEARCGELLDTDVLVDALLGTGLQGPVEGWLGQVLADVNVHHGRYRVLAVDIPSGLPSDGGDPVGESIRADATVTLTAPKRAHIFPPNSTRVGTLAVAPIGTPEELTAGDPELYLNLITARTFARLPLTRDPSAHKGDFGHVLLLAGSRGKTGAAALAGVAALRMGAGLSTVATPASCLPIIASLAAEIMIEPLPETDAGSLSARGWTDGTLGRILEGKTVLGLGPGLGTHPDTVELVRQVVEEVSLPLVLDADALNALAGQLDGLRHRRAQTLVLTPHPGEMARLLGITSAAVQRQRVELARQVSRDSGVFVILKGYRTLVATPAGAVYVNPTGNPGMASGGVGDVLTGVVAGALAEFPSAPVEQVLALAVFLHGRAGDLTAASGSEQGLIASDVSAALPRAWTWLRERIERDRPGSYYLLP